MLREKWSRELRRRFGVKPDILGAGEFLQFLREVADGSRREFAVVASLQGLRPPSGWDDNEESGEPRAVLARLLQQRRQDGTILFAPDATTIQRMSASGGSPTPVTRLNTQHHELFHGYPSFLPDGRHFLYWVFSSDKPREGVYLGTIDSAERRQLLPLRSRAEYANGYLFFGRDGSLMAQPSTYVGWSYQVMPRVWPKSLAIPLEI